MTSGRHTARPQPIAGALLSLLVPLFLALPAVGTPALAQQESFEEQGFYQSYKFGNPDDPSEAWLMSFGGRLYDQWWAVLFVDPPKGTHPSYPATGARSGLQSWRCVTCHGWDYRGRDGAFAEGPDFTGFPGIQGAAGADPQAIVAVLRDETHGFGPDLIPDQAALALALFVSRGQVDARDIVEAGSNRIMGDPERGRALFQNICAVCHDFDGRAWIEGEGDLGNTLGAIASGDPWRALHKVMNGQTYADMPALRALGAGTVADVLSYVQTLPKD